MAKYVKQVLVLLSVLSLPLLVPACGSFAKTKVSGNIIKGGMPLKRIPVFYNYLAYRDQGENAAVLSDKLVVDSSVLKKTYKVTTTGIIMLPFNGWGGFSVAQYYENGAFEFDVRGETGFEDFQIGFRSDTRGRESTHYISLSSAGIKITKKWQRVRVPIKAIVDSAPEGFSMDNIYIVIINNPIPCTYYLSDMFITSPDYEKQHPVIKVNQAGYRSDHAKFALVSCFPGSINLSEKTEFKVIDKNNGSVQFTDTLKVVVKDTDPTSGETVFKAEFSGLKKPGVYYISITEPKVENSFSFPIGDDVYYELFKDSIRYFYFQRQGLDLEEKHAGIFARKNLHPNDAAVRKISQRNNNDAPVYDVSQGWYDAGDYGKYFPPAAATVSDLLFAYETFPSLFTDNQFNIPESGNGLPDMLDEIKWELDMMLKFEDGTTGGFWEVANYSGNIIYFMDTHGSGGAPDTKSTGATASAAGIFAHAYMVYRDFPRHAAFANRCLDAAKRAWDYLEAHPGNDWIIGAGRNYHHSDADVNMIKFYGACALYRATGTAKYHDYILKTYQGFDYKREFNSYQVYSTGEIGKGFIHYALAANKNAEVVKFFDGQFTKFQSVQLNNYQGKAWPTLIVDWAYFWGSCMPICHTPTELFIFNKVLGKDLAMPVQIIRDSVHYVMGINPLSYSFVSGHGEHCVKNIYSTIYTKDGIDEIPPGYMAGGANQYDAGFMSNWVSKCYVDSDKEWTTNENAIYWNAALALLLTLERGTADIETGSKFASRP
ncbi:MAG: glycoside hydrolase family 9 protein [Treponema sp.]|jgi:hypothetical protein|nr:glycoside hydrolase family 9 protein [Treponema sp.]